MTDYTKLAAEIGALVTSKQAQYGDSVSKSGRILEILYPEGVQTHQYQDALMVVRILDKLSRIAQRGPDGQDLGGESPYRDIAGYGLLGASKDGAPVVEDAERNFVLPDWAYWKEHPRHDMSLYLAANPYPMEMAYIGKGVCGRFNYWVVGTPGETATHGLVDSWDAGIEAIYKSVNWTEWGNQAVLMSSAESAAEHYPVETIADKSPHWDSVYSRLRKSGHGQVAAARMADEVCQTTAQ